MYLRYLILSARIRGYYLAGVVVAVLGTPSSCCPAYPTDRLALAGGKSASYEDPFLPNPRPKALLNSPSLTPTQKTAARIIKPTTNFIQKWRWRGRSGTYRARTFYRRLAVVKSHRAFRLNLFFPCFRSFFYCLIIKTLLYIIR